MDNTFLIVFIAALLFGIIGVIFWAYFSEKKKKEKIRESFKSFSKKKKLKNEDLRSVPRLEIPYLLTVFLTLTDEPFFGLKAAAIDISETGFSVKPDFPLRKLPIDTILNNVLVKTPINNFTIEKMKTVRYEYEIKKRVLAFKIITIEKSQKNKMLIFMNHLDKYLKDEES